MADKKNQEEVPEIDKKGQALIDEAAKAYGIAPEFIIGSNVDSETGEAVIVTAGGAKVRYAKGDKPTPLDPVRVDGVVRKAPRHVAGKKADKNAEK